jgi:hypothetical protein
MDGGSAARSCRRNDPGLLEIGADGDGLVSLAHERQRGVDVRMDGDGANAEPARGFDDPPGDFAAIGDEKAIDQATIPP